MNNSGKQKKSDLNTPYRKNDVVTVRIEDIGQDGEGIGHTEDGYTLFVKDAVLGDTVTAKIMKATPKYAYAHLETVEEPSPFRVEPVCGIYKSCGGCQIQALSYDKQLEFKQKKVRNDLVRIGGFAPEVVDAVLEPIVGMEDPYRFRNKEQVPVGKGRDGKPVTGFYAGRTHDIVPMTECYIGAAENQQILSTILTWMKRYDVPPYDEKTHEGLIRHILLRSGVYSREIMVCIIAAAEKLPHEAQLIEALCVLPDMTSISLNTNTARNNVILGKTIRTLWGSDTIEDSLHELTVTKDGFTPSGRQVLFRISPLSFYQVNPRQTEKLYSIALDYASLTGTETVLDLYCGIGTISLFMAPHAKSVFGVEIVPDAIRDARKNAERNNIGNVIFENGQAEEVLPAYFARRRQSGNADPVDVIVVDPPRKGLDDVTIATMLKLRPKKIVYVSCDPATLARDLKKLCGTPGSLPDADILPAAYELKRVRPVDQFGHSVHIETVCLLTHS